METAAIVAGLYALVIPIVSGLERAEVECLCPRGMVGLSEHRRFTDPAREVDHFGDQPRRLAKIGAHVIDVSEASYRSEEILIAIKLPAHFFCLVYIKDRLFSLRNTT